MNLTPNLQLDISQDFSDTTGVDDEMDFKVTFKHFASLHSLVLVG